jgi:hypothetical protein
LNELGKMAFTIIIIILTFYFENTILYANSSLLLPFGVNKTSKKKKKTKRQE